MIQNNQETQTMEGLTPEKGEKVAKTVKKYANNNKKMLTPDKIGETQIKEYNTKEKGESTDFNELMTYFEVFNPYVEMPKKLSEWMSIATDKGLVTLIEKNSSYHKVCVYGYDSIIDDGPVMDSIPIMTNDCDCMWVSDVFMKVYQKHPALFETRFKKHPKSNMISYFNIFNPEKLREHAKEAVEGAEKYLCACLDVLEKREKEEYLYCGSGLGLTPQEVLENDSLGYAEVGKLFRKPFDKKNFEPIRKGVLTYMKIIVSNHERLLRIQPVTESVANYPNNTV